MHAAGYVLRFSTGMRLNSNSCQCTQMPLGLQFSPSVWGQADVGAFIEKVKSEYYQDGVREGLLPADLFEDVAKSGGVRPKAGWDAVIFASRPGSGGAVLQLSPDDAAKLL